MKQQPIVSARTERGDTISFVDYPSWSMRELLAQIAKHERVEPRAHYVFVSELADRIFRFLPKWAAVRPKLVDLPEPGEVLVNDHAALLFAAMKGRLP